MPTDLCFMPASDPATANDRLHLDLGRSAADRDQKSTASMRSEPAESTSGSPTPNPRPPSPIMRENEFCVLSPKEALIR
jgi:hypothetical protein